VVWFFYGLGFGEHMDLPITLVLVLFALGAVVGFLAGLLGIGGGGIMVPVLTSVFMWQQVPLSHAVHMALATSMAAIIPTALASTRSHHRRQAVLWPVVWRLAPGIVLGTLLITHIASGLDARFLAIFFACFMALVAAQMVIAKPKTPTSSAIPVVSPSTASLPLAMSGILTAAVGMVIGGISALVAIGGGTMTVPFLVWRGVEMPKAIATSAAVGIPIAVCGALGYFLAGAKVDAVLPWSLGFVYVPAVVLIASLSVLTAPYGAALTHKLPVQTLKRIFALLIVLLSGQMLWQVLRG
jgi:uncharacterized membrane protein YfcA